jgi:hypothetical protein
MTIAELEANLHDVIDDLAGSEGIELRETASRLHDLCLGNVTGT